MNLPPLSRTANAVLTGAAFLVFALLGIAVIWKADAIDGVGQDQGNTFTVKFDGHWLKFNFADGRSAIVREKSISALEYWPTAKAKQLRLPPHINMVVGAHTQRIDLDRDQDEQGLKLYNQLLGFIDPEGEHDNAQGGERNGDGGD